MYYPYILVCHLKSQTLCRHWKYDPIPEGFVRIIWYRRKIGHKFRYYPYDPTTNELKPEYWSLPRTTDNQFKEIYNGTTNQ